MGLILFIFYNPIHFFPPPNTSPALTNHPRPHDCMTSLLPVLTPTQKHVLSFAAGSLASLGFFSALGYVPLWFGPETRAWNRAFWDSTACSFLDTMDADPDYSLYRALESTRNFLQTGPHCDTGDDRRVRRVFYFSRKNRILRGIVHFGADCEGPPRCVHGGCTAAFVDAALGVCAYRTAMMPCVTANLSVNYRDKIPLGSQLGIECKYESSEGIRKWRFTFRLYSLRDESKVYADGGALFINAVVPSNKNIVPPFLAWR